MGVSMSWSIVKPTMEHSFAHGSNLYNSLESLFGGFPFQVNERDIPKLQGLAAAYEDINELISAIYEHGIVEVRAHW